MNLPNIENVEQAYKIIAQTVVTIANTEQWEWARLECEIYPTMLYKKYMHFWSDTLHYGRGRIPLSEDQSSDAIRFLAADILQTTGQRVWGLTFTYHANGKFDLEYNYNKPDDYEESDETIDVTLYVPENKK